MKLLLVPPKMSANLENSTAKMGQAVPLAAAPRLPMAIST
jgi:hypothetical protein